MINVDGRMSLQTVIIQGYILLFVIANCVLLFIIWNHLIFKLRKPLVFSVMLKILKSIE